MREQCHNPSLNNYVEACTRKVDDVNSNPFPSNIGHEKLVIS